MIGALFCPTVKMKAAFIHKSLIASGQAQQQEERSTSTIQLMLQQYIVYLLAALLYCTSVLMNFMASSLAIDRLT